MSENNTLAQAEITTPQTSAEPQVAARTESNVATLDERAYHELVQGLKETAEPAPTPEAPKEEPTAEQAPAVEEAEAPAETKAEDETQETEAELPERVRIGSWSENERKALKIRARNPDLTLEQAMAMVKGEAEPAKAQEEQFVAPADIEAKIDEVAQAKAAAFKNLEFDKVAELEVEMLKLNKELRKSEKLATERENVQQTQRVKGIEEAKARAVEFYPDAGKADSALVKKMNEIFDTMVDTGNPLVKDPSMPFKLTQMAANELGIAPRNPSAKAPSPSVARKAPSIQPASGNARTTPTAPLNAKALADKLDDLESYQLLMAKL
jgi:hypothetical protein